MNVPFVSPSTIVNQHSHLHMVCILNWLVARPQQCLNWRCICLGSLTSNTSHVFCFDAIGWSQSFHEDPELKGFHILWKNLKLQKNLHFCRCFFSDIFKYGNMFSIRISYNNVCLSTLTKAMRKQFQRKFQTFSTLQMDHCCHCKFCHNRANAF